MATKVLKNAVITLDSNNISAYCEQVNINYEADEVEDTNFGDDTHIFKGGGLKKWDMDLVCKQDYAASALDSIIWPLIGTEVTISVMPDTGGVSATNPDYTGTTMVKGFQPIAGAVGELAKTGIKLLAAGTLSRNTS